MTSTFEQFAPRLEVHRLVETGELPADRLVSAVRELDAAVARVEGHGFERTPFGPSPELADAAGIGTAELWVKNEIGNVSGSHKARHLFGVALAHRLADADAGAEAPPYAIASCGNAALAAAVLSRAVGRRIDVFVPTWANDAVVARITELGGRVVRCEREPGVSGDPAHHAMLAAIEAGAVPFSCQGTETPATIDGGRTLAWEMVDSLVEHDGGRPGPPRPLVRAGRRGRAGHRGGDRPGRRGWAGRSRSHAQGPRRAARGQPSPGEGLGHAGA